MASLWVVIDSVTLRHERELVHDGVEESKDGEANYRSARVPHQRFGDLHMAQASPPIAVTRLHQWKSGRQFSGMRERSFPH